MPSESTSALGQPRETNPTLGSAATGACMRTSALLLVARRLVVRFLRAAGLRAESGYPGEAREGEAGEHVARLVLQLLLHLQEHVAALLHVRRDEALHGRALEAHELLPQLLVEFGGLPVELLRLFLHALLDLAEQLHVALEVRTEHPLHRVPVGANELRENVR